MSFKTHMIFHFQLNKNKIFQMMHNSDQWLMYNVMWHVVIHWKSSLHAPAQYCLTFLAYAYVNSLNVTQIEFWWHVK